MVDRELFVIVKRDGAIRKHDRAGLAVYSSLSIAKNQCRIAGDSVVRALFSLAGEPLFIRSKKVSDKQIEAADTCGAAACLGCRECK